MITTYFIIFSPTIYHEFVMESDKVGFSSFCKVFVCSELGDRSHSYKQSRLMQTLLFSILNFNLVRILLLFTSSIFSFHREEGCVDCRCLPCAFALFTLICISRI